VEAFACLILVLVDPDTRFQSDSLLVRRLASLMVPLLDMVVLNDELLLLCALGIDLKGAKESRMRCTAIIQKSENLLERLALRARTTGLKRISTFQVSI
jgi:hypothetical protein